jgi:DDE superfamily endonuclease
MLLLPSAFASVIVTFAPLFFKRTWHHAEQLLWGALLAPGKRTVTGVLRILGYADDRRFQRFHRVLNRARWRPRAASRILLGLLVKTFAPTGPLVVALDDTIERRWGKKIAARGIYRDPVRSSRSHFVKVSGLRWLSLMLVTEIPWASRCWALPFLTVLAPSERYHEQRQRRHKKLTDWARQMLLPLRRWLPDRELVLVVDSGYAALGLLGRRARLPRPITCITRLRLDAALYQPVPPRKKGQKGPPRKKGPRLPKLSSVLKSKRTEWTRVTVGCWYGAGKRVMEVATGTAVWYTPGQRVLPIRWVLVRDPEQDYAPEALLSTEVQAAPEQIVPWFVWRWQTEVTFAEARAHLGMETQRQHTDQAIARTTPCLLALFSLVALLADALQRQKLVRVRSAAWYDKEHRTFADAMAAVRQQLWASLDISMSEKDTEMVTMPRRLLQHLTEALAYAA